MRVMTQKFQNDVGDKVKEIRDDVDKVMNDFNGA